MTKTASKVAITSGFMPVIAGITVATGIDLPSPAGTGPNMLSLATSYPVLGNFIRTGLRLDVIDIPQHRACFAVAALT